MAFYSHRAIRCLAASCIATLACSHLVSQEPSAILISIDGLRADVISPETAPRLAGLVDRGLSTMEARSLFPTFTIPNHISMATGQIPQTHGFEMITSPPENLKVDGSIFEIAHDAGMRTGLYLSKTKLHSLAKPGVYDRLVMTNDNTSDVAVAQLRSDLADPELRPRLAMLHITELDAIGHQDGWLSAGYFAALVKADGFVGDVLDVLEREGLQDEFYVLITSDHGGDRFSHQAYIREVYEIPWIGVGPDVPRGVIRHRQISTHDNAPTLLGLLGLEIPEHMEGISLADVLADELPAFLRGDVNVDSEINLSDAVHLLNLLFQASESFCDASNDVNADDSVNLSDPVYLLNFLFLSGQEPAGPFPSCDELSLGTTLDCNYSCM